MYRYLALAWNAADPRQAATVRLICDRLQLAATRWQCHVSRRGLMAFDADARPGSSESQVLGTGCGVVFGTVFARAEGGRGTRRVFLDARKAGEIATFGARHLVDRYWGRYVAVAEDAATAAVWVLRDPSGALPCFVTKFRGVHVFFSDLEDCLALDLCRFTVNWDYVAAAAANSALQTRETGLNEVTEVLPGECVELQGDTLRRSLAWNPVQIAQRDPVESVEEATTELHETTRACVQSWSSCYGGILLSLSGGLDSSIVLSCLADGARRPVVTCLNYYATGPDEDERRYARLAADRAGVMLIERQLEVREVELERILQVRRSAKPGYYVAALQRQRLESQLAQRIGASAIFSGGGGDAVFYQGRPDLAVGDLVHRRGIRPDMWRVALDAARITGLSVWPLVRRGIRAGLLRPEWRPWAGNVADRTLVSARAIEASRNNPRWRHPWLENTAGVPHGTLWHVLSLSVPTSFYESFDRPDDPERTYPLLSQPLVELCLRIPTYVLISGGWDRAIARFAFADEVPREIIWRRAKGGINQLSTRILDANIAFVREMLLDGLLVREGILERARLEECLSGKRSPTDFEYNEILHEHLSIEAWLRRGSELQARAAA